MQREQTPSAPDRRRAVRQILDQHGWEELEQLDLENWDGRDLEGLRTLLTDEQFQALLDDLGDGDPQQA